MIKFRHPKRFDTVRAWFAEAVGIHPHLERCKSPAASRKYCEKDGDVVELGNRDIGIIGKRGARTDLKEVERAAKKGLTLGQAIENGVVGNYQQSQYFNVCRRALLRPEPREMRVIWLYGPTGVGKSTQGWEILRDMAGEDPIAVKTNDDKFFVYDGEENMLWDEVQHLGAGPLSSFLGIAGGRPYMQRLFGGCTPCRVKNLVITSHHHPFDLLENKDRWPEVARRLNRGCVLCRQSPFPTDWTALRDSFTGDDAVTVSATPPVRTATVPSFHAGSGSAY